MTSPVSTKIKKAKSVLLVPIQKPDSDILLSTHALYNALVEAGKTCQIYLAEPMRKFVGEQKIIWFDEFLKNKIIISVPNKNNELEDVNWEDQHDGMVNIIISTKTGSVNTSALKISKYTNSFDLVILIGLKTLEELGEFYTANMDIFESSQVFIARDLDKRSENFRGDNKSIAQDMVSFLAMNNLPINEKIASLLLTALYAGTANFRNYVDEKTFKTAAKLIEQGGELQEYSVEQKPEEVMKTTPTEEMKVELKPPPVSNNQPVQKAKSVETTLPITPATPTNKNVLQDPLAPATEFPKALELGSPIKPQQNSGPLPPVGNI